MSFKFRLYAFRPSRTTFVHPCCVRSAASRLADKLLTVEPRYSGRAVYLVA